MTTGSKVICIDGTFPEWCKEFYVAFPVEGKTYTIRDMMPGINGKGEPEIAVTLREIVNPKSNKAPFPERAFNIERFRDLEMTVEEMVKTEHEKGRQVEIKLIPQTA